MYQYKNSIQGLINLLESKDHLIDKLDLTEEQKNKLKDFFKVYPTFENKIDWNRKDLSWDDFQEILALEGTTKSSQKKYGISGKAQIEDLVEGKDYNILKEAPEFTAYRIKTFKAAEVLAKPTTPPVGVTGKWCIAGRNYSPGTRDQHWNEYTSKGCKFIYIFTKTKKYAIAYTDGKIECFNHGDHKIKCPEEYKQLVDSALTDEQKFEQKFWKNLEKTDKIIIPEGITIIPEEAFYNNSSIKNVIIPDSVTTIGNFAFNGCTSLTSITIPDSVTNIGESGFDKCTGLTSITIPNSVTNIGDFAFDHCSSLTSITIPNSVTSIGSYAFGHCSGLTSVTIGNSVTTIGNFAFNGCTSLTSITIPDSVSWIGASTFRNCTGLTRAVIGNSVTDIGFYTFYGCSELTSIVIGKSVTNIGHGAFGECKNLTNIVFSGTRAQWNAINIEADQIYSRPWNYRVPATVVHCSDGDIQL